jgi:hypothetical protein
MRLLHLVLVLSALALGACSESEPDEESVIGDSLEEAADRAREVEDILEREAQELRDAVEELEN